MTSSRTSIFDRSVGVLVCSLALTFVGWVVSVVNVVLFRAVGQFSYTNYAWIETFVGVFVFVNTLYLVDTVVAQRRISGGIWVPDLIFMVLSIVTAGVTILAISSALNSQEVSLWAPFPQAIFGLFAIAAQVHDLGWVKGRTKC